MLFVKDLFIHHQPLVSFEFFPPKSGQDMGQFHQTRDLLLAFHPAFVSVTCGAGGSTRDQTHDLAVAIQRQADLPVVAHVTCLDSSREEIRQLLERYAAQGITNIMALRGDPPKGKDWATVGGDFAYTSDLVAFIKAEFPQMGVGVAGFPEGHPQTPNRLKEMDFLKMKVDAGADYIVTQLFFENRDFFDFCERCAVVGIHVPVLAGVLPITSRAGMIRMADLAAGARYPGSLLRVIESAGDNDAQIEQIGVRWAAEQIHDLLEQQVRGVHLYTLNRAHAILKIFDALDIRDLRQIKVSL